MDEQLTDVDHGLQPRIKPKNAVETQYVRDKVVGKRGEVVFIMERGDAVRLM